MSIRPCSCHRCFSAFLLWALMFVVCAHTVVSSMCLGLFCSDTVVRYSPGTAASVVDEKHNAAVLVRVSVQLHNGERDEKGKLQKLQESEIRFFGNRK